MDFLTALGVFNYGLVLIFGFFLSIFIAGGWEDQSQKRLVYVLCVLFFAVQAICWFSLGIDVTKELYPLIVHLPLVLTLIFVLKKQPGIALTSVFTAYLCCQLPRWINLTFTALFSSALIGEISYTLCIGPVFFLLHRYFVEAAHDAITYSRRSQLLFGILPFAYYLFDYSTVIYTHALYLGIPVITEFFPTLFLVFYVIFIAAYHAQMSERAEAELQHSILKEELKQSTTEIENLRNAENQAAMYQHDMRHHLAAIGSLLSAGQPEQAEEYVRKVQTDVESVMPKRFCKNQLVSLLCSSFSSKAERMNIRLEIDAKLPQHLSISDTELCAILSNGLENALRAVSETEEPFKWIEFHCSVRLNKLLIEIRNPYAGEIIMQNGLPVSCRDGHGYGCRSIRSISEQNRGFCSFEAQNGIFTLRVILPLLGLDNGQ